MRAHQGHTAFNRVSPAALILPIAASTGVLRPSLLPRTFLPSPCLQLLALAASSLCQGLPRV